MDLYEVVMKLVGPVEAVGETRHDAHALANLKELTNLTGLLLWKIGKAAETANRDEFSMQKIGKHAEDFLKEVRES